MGTRSGYPEYSQRCLQAPGKLGRLHVVPRLQDAHPPRRVRLRFTGRFRLGPCPLMCVPAKARAHASTHSRLRAACAEPDRSLHAATYVSTQQRL